MMDCIFGYTVVGILMALAANALTPGMAWWKHVAVVVFWLPALIGLIIMGHVKGGS